VTRFPAALLAVFPLLAAPPEIEKRLQVRVPMRDGVGLAANVFRRAGAGPLPVILVRTPYGKGKDLSANYRSFVERGYVVVVQDVRGRYDSEGVFDPLAQEPRDGEDTLSWIAAQPWANSRIGMIGGSYLGIVQWKVALLNHPRLKAIFPVVSGGDDYFDRFYSRGGAMKLGNRLLWMSDNMRAPGFAKPDFSLFTRHLPLRGADTAATGQRVPMYQTALDHPAYDAYWKRLSTREKLDRIRVPVFSVGGWYDNFVESDLEVFAALRGLGRTIHTVIGPWPHNMSVPFTGVDFGKDSSFPVRHYQLEWFDRWLKGITPARPQAPLRIFVMGANRWREEENWPPTRAVYHKFFLASRRGANSLTGDGKLVAQPPRRERVDTYTYDPRRPVPTLGGSVCCNPQIFPWGPQDQRPVEQRPDVLVYTTAPLPRDLEVTGPVKAMLWISTSAPDTDFTAKLVEVFPDGAARNLTDGILRLRYRQSIEKAVLAEAGQVYPIEIQAGPTSNLFRGGHRIRLEVSSSNFPRFDRNPNTGRPIAGERDLRVAHQQIHVGGKQASYLLLPVVE
jgi:hypothetical protein